MIDEHVQDEWSKELLDVLGGLEQGDVVEGLPFGYYATGSPVAWKPSATASKDATEFVELDPGVSPKQWAITTHTCDLCEEDSDRPRRPFFLAAPVYEADALNERQQFMITNMEVSYLVRLTGDNFSKGFWIADLRLQIPFDKGVLVGKPIRKGFAPEDVRRFGAQLARLYGRPVFPREVVMNVVDSLRSFFGGGKAHYRERFGAAKIEELRLYCSNNGPPYETQLWVILESPATEKIARECIDAWYRSTQPRASSAGVNLLAPQFQVYDLMSAADYIRTKPVSIPYIRVD